MKIYDNKISNQVLFDAILEAETTQTYQVLHPSGNGSYGFKYNWAFCPPGKNGKIENVSLKNLWLEIKNHLPTNTILRRGYINAHTYGVEDTIHEDDVEIQNGLTVIVYLCRSWYPEWFGQTVFFESLSNQKNEIVASVLPKPNRFIVFNKKDPHCVAPLSRRFAGVRLTCMFKIELLNESA